MFVVGERRDNRIESLAEASLAEPPSVEAGAPVGLFGSDGWGAGRVLLPGGSEDHESSGAIPWDLDQMEPGLVLAAHLARIDLACLSGFERVVVLRAHQRMASHYQAHLYGDMAAVADHLEEEFSGDAELGHEAAAAEIRVALRLTRRAADVELDLARSLVERLPAVWEAFVSGDLDARRARVLVNGTRHLPRETAREVADQVVGRAGELTTGQLKAALAKLCVDVDPDQAERRYRHAVSDRRVWVEASGEGTAHLWAMDLPPHRASEALARINRLAQTLRGSTESRSMDQLRADVFLDLLCGKKTASRARGGGVEIRVDLATLAELTNTSGELAGFGPVIADIARQTTHHQTTAPWRFVVTHPDSGQPVVSGITRRRPTATQRRNVEATYPTCVFPGCRIPATACDLDHRTPWSHQGPTVETNLAPLCRHDHRIRHQAGWTHQPLPGGDHQWTTPLGHLYTTSGKPP